MNLDATAGGFRVKSGQWKQQTAECRACLWHASFGGFVRLARAATKHRRGRALFVVEFGGLRDVL